MCTQDAEGDSNHPLLRAPRDYELLWADESAARDKCLAIWKPVAMPGYALVLVISILSMHSCPALAVEQ